LSSLGLGSLRH